MSAPKTARRIRRRATVVAGRVAIAFGSLASFAPHAAPYSLPRSDDDAMRSDWRAVGDDLRTAMNRLDEQTKSVAR